MDRLVEDYGRPAVVRIDHRRVLTKQAFIDRFCHHTIELTYIH